LKHGECSAADGYGKDLEGRYTNNEHQNHQKVTEKNIKRVQIIRNMVLGSIKFESVSLFTIICSDVEL